MNTKLETATFGGGCFWCPEAIFQEIKGVITIVSGYSGGTVPGKPTYKEICSGFTGHAEVVQITFDTNSISFSEILVIFMTTHNPTTLNKQGGDIGTQYRSVIFYHTKKQQEIANEVLKQLTTVYEDVIVTELSPLTIFYEAEKEHQAYYKNNSTKSYCSFVITPKLTKLRQLHSNKLKT